MTKIDDILTPREKEVIRLMCKGYSNKEIAEILGISLTAVQIFSASIMQKLDVSTYVHNGIKKAKKLNPSGIVRGDK